MGASVTLDYVEPNFVVSWPREIDLDISAVMLAYQKLAVKMGDANAAIFITADPATAAALIADGVVDTVTKEAKTKLPEITPKVDTPREPPRLWSLPADRFQRLAEAGFRADLLPAAPPDAVLSPKSKSLTAANVGKVPGKLLDDGWCGFTGWSNHVTTAEHIDIFSTWPNASVGLHYRNHDDGTSKLGWDHDIRDPEIAELCRAEFFRRFGVMPYRIGADPKFLIVTGRSFALSKYRLAFKKNPNDKTEQAQALELLGHGHYANLIGAHSVKHGLYTWHGGDLADWATAGKIVVIPEHEANDYCKWFIALMISRGYTRCEGSRGSDGVDNVHTGRRAPVGFIPDQPHHVAQAIAYLTNAKRAAPAITGEHGDDQTVVVANILGDLGIEREMALELMAEHWNDTCDPPWTDQELETKVYSAYKSRQNDIGCDTFEAQFASTEAPRNGDTDTKPKSDRPFLLSLDDIFCLPDPNELVSGLLMQGENCCFAGPPKVGKSFVVLDIALSIAAGLPVFGFLQVRRPGAVVYLSGEGHSGIKRRIAAWCQDHGISPAERAAIPFYYKASVPMTRGGVAECQKFIDGIREQIGCDPVLVIIDTMARSLGGEDENSAATAALYLAMTEHLRDKLNSTVLTVAHSGKIGEPDIRGSSGFTGGFDAVWVQTFNKDTKIALLEGKWMKEDEQLGPFGFRLEPIVVEGNATW